MRTVHWGMIGCGDVAEVKSGPGFYKCENSTLEAVSSLRVEKAKNYAKRHNVPKVYESADELINDPIIDAVYIATPPAFHKEYAIKCAIAKKVAYIEKPMAQTYKDCLEIIQEFKKTNTCAFVAYYRRAMERFNKVKELIDNKFIGDIRFVNVILYKKTEKEDYCKNNLPWRLIPKVAGGGKFVDMAVHAIDILDFLFGPLSEVKGKASNQAGLYEVEDIVTANWNFKNGIQGTGTWCFTAFENYDKVEIIGSKGKIYFEFFSQNPIYVKTEENTVEYRYNDPEHVQQPFIQSIVNQLTGKGKCNGDLESAARTSKVVDEILKEYRINKNFKEFI
ncbi:oxidoreductase [Clostridium pasteurianum]|nr:oxidoreductase [Clostridium pasteurianum DSM 525 = ATCC 6013]AOZ81160.1 oxidoreductase [Clostridium pasteurianum]ELP60073.1 oxidoreductase [Clostridium pasteurianum DSM 525 = ATCC 6013]OMH22076.1 oxidoreductase [Clostridium pasteurianum]